MIFIFAKKMVAKEDAGKLKMSRQRLPNQDNMATTPTCL